MVKICNLCGKTKEMSDFHKNSRRKDGYENFCKECAKKKRKIYTHICEHCGKKFKSLEKRTKFCSHICANIHRTNPKYKAKHICETCGKEFYEYLSQTKNNKHTYCSLKCKAKNEKILFKGEKSIRWNKNKPLEERERDRKYPEYYEWRRKVYERDNYTCQCCGDNKGHNLVAHHILNYSEHKDKRTDIDNGITLCKTCHMEYHNLYGYENNNKKQFIVYINTRKEAK